MSPLIVSEEVANTFKIGNLLWERIELYGDSEKEKLSRKRFLIDKYIATATYLLLNRGDLKLTWPTISDMGDAIEMKAEIVAV